MDGGSLALWYHWKAAQKGQATRAAAEVHINLWRRRVKKLSNKEESFLDLGFRFKDSSSISDFRLYLPFAISQSSIVDLGSVLHDQTTMMAIFNEAYVADALDGSGGFSIRNTDGKEMLSCHSLKPGVDFTVATRGEGTIVHFTDRLCIRFASDADQYIRFRINLDRNTDKTFSRLHRQFDWVFLSAIPRDEVVEFIFNERRSIPQEIIDEMFAQKTNEIFRMVAVHCFLIRESDSKFEMSHSDFHKVRLLETHLWSTYLQGTQAGDLHKDSFIYHWRRIAALDADLGDYHALAHFKRLITGWWTIGFYVIVILIIGVAGNLFASFIWEHWPWPGWPFPSIWNGVVSKPQPAITKPTLPGCP